MKIIIVGAGEVGFHIASRLATENKDVVVIDKNPQALARVSEKLDVQVVEGSGSNPVVLRDAGISQAEIILAVTDSDDANLVSSLFANILSPATKKLVRLRDMDYTGFLEELHKESPHIDTVINPELELVRTVERMLSIPGAEDVAEFADGRVKLIGVRIPPDSHHDGMRLLDIPARLGGRNLLIAAIVRNEQLLIPTGKDSLAAGDLVYFITEEKRLPEALKFFKKKADVIRRALVVGGGRTGMRMAGRLAEKGIKTKLVEREKNRASALAEELDQVVILYGDGSDQELLAQENVADMDVVITLTGDEETNILTSLLACRMGAKKAVTRIDKFSYFPLMSAIGIENVISPRLSAINSILQHVRRGKVLSSVALKGEHAEVLEAVALPTSDVVGKLLKDLYFPKGALVISILRDDQVIIPTGDSMIRPHDRIVIISSKAAVPNVEKALAVKLEFF